VIFDTGQREWDELSKQQKRSYLLGENVLFATVGIGFFALLGYLARWNDHEWWTALGFAVFGLFCCLVIFMVTIPIRLDRIRRSKARTRAVRNQA